MHTVSEPTAYTGPGLHAFAFPDDTAVFAVGDVHGRARGLRELLAAMADTPTPGLRRHLVCTGDLVDRGLDNLGVLRTVAGACVDYGFDALTVLPGNHDLMMLDGMDVLLATGDVLHPRAHNWFENGGMHTLAEASPPNALTQAASPEDWKDMANAFRAALPLLQGQPWLDALREAPSHLRAGDALFVHAGVMPKLPQSATLDLPAHQHCHLFVQNHHWAWLRKPFMDWQGGFYRDGKKGRLVPGARGTLVVHGHSGPNAKHAWLDDAHTLQTGMSRMATNARLNLDLTVGTSGLVGGALLTAQTWQVMAADGLDA